MFGCWSLTTFTNRTDMSIGSQIRDDVLELLEREGPMTISDVAEALALPRQKVVTCIIGARYDFPKRWFKIVAYKWQEDGAGREIPIYSHEGGDDAKRPRYTAERKREQQRKYYRKHSARLNAKAQMKRRKGKTSINPWLQLAPVEMRPVMSRATRNNV